MWQLFRRPCAFLPVLMSIFVLAVILIRLARFGIVRQADEGMEAHFFQILMPAQVPLTAFFATAWLPKMPFQAAKVLALQGFAAFLPLSIVFWLRL